MASATNTTFTGEVPAAAKIPAAAATNDATTNSSDGRNPSSAAGSAFTATWEPLQDAPLPPDRSGDLGGRLAPRAFMLSALMLARLHPRVSPTCRCRRGLSGHPRRGKAQCLLRQQPDERAERHQAEPDPDPAHERIDHNLQACRLVLQLEARHDDVQVA